MKHSIDREKAGPFAESMAEAIETCVHCGFCLPACPTYQEMGQEADSPRGRIFLMKQVLEGELEPADVSQHVDQCLGCLACETACPSGVKYRDLISPYRATIPRHRSFWERVRDRMVSLTIPFPTRFRWAIRIGQWTRWLNILAPRPLRAMAEMIPDQLPAPVRLKPIYRARGEERCQVALLAGCAQQVLAPQINENTIRLLNACGATVVVPSNQSCCGALSWHNGQGEQAKRLAARNFEKFTGDYQWIVTNAAGCGSGMKEYEVLFGDSPMASSAKSIAERTVDISVLLQDLGLGDRLATLPNPSDGKPVRVAYHDACHLSHGQSVRAQPRSLLHAAPGVEVIELGPEMCCGSAGTYNIEQPATAHELGRQKAEAVIRSGADYLVTGNIGCIVQIQKHLQALGSPIQVRHLVDFLTEQFPELVIEDSQPG